GSVSPRKAGRPLAAGEPLPLFPGAPPRAAVFDFSADGVRRSLAESLERLDLDRVDIVLIHDPDDQLDQAVTEAYPALEALRSQGVVRRIGVGMNQWQGRAGVVRETGGDSGLGAGRSAGPRRGRARRVLRAC